MDKPFKIAVECSYILEVDHDGCPITTYISRFVPGMWVEEPYRVIGEYLDCGCISPTGKRAPFAPLALFSAASKLTNGG